MIRKIIYGIYAIIGMMVVAACSSRPDVYEISLEKMQGFPSRLSLEEQGKFMLGYYHQVQKRYEKKEEK